MLLRRGNKTIKTLCPKIGTKVKSQVIATMLSKNISLHNSLSMDVKIFLSEIFKGILSLKYGDWLRIFSAKISQKNEQRMLPISQAKTKFSENKTKYRINFRPPSKKLPK